MKTLSISRLCLVGALMLGLLVAWSAAAPQQIAGNLSIGAGACCCTGTDPQSCPTGCSGQLVVCTWGDSGSTSCFHGLTSPCSGEGCNTYHDARYCSGGSCG